MVMEHLSFLHGGAVQRALIKHQTQVRAAVQPPKSLAEWLCQAVPAAVPATAGLLVERAHSSTRADAFTDHRGILSSASTTCTCGLNYSGGTL